MSATRTERRFGVTSQLTPRAVRNLLLLRKDEETWNDLLDVFEMCCIEIETELINTAAEDERAVLANHKMSKAAWVMFTQMQQKVDQAINSYLASVATQPVTPSLSPEEQIRDYTVNPLLYPTESEDGGIQ